MAVKEARTPIIRRWRKNMELGDSPDDRRTSTCCPPCPRARCGATSIRTPTSTGIRPSLPSSEHDERWILPPTDPIGKHPWYQSQSTERQIEIGMWRQANVAKVGLHFESILIRGLMEYAFWMPNGSPEYRYCLHEAVEECNHTMMFQEMVNRIGADVPGMPRMLKWVQPVIPLAAGPLPILVLLRHSRRRRTHRPHPEERAPRGQGAASDHGAGDGHPCGRGGSAHLVRARVPAQAGASSAAAQAVLAVAVRADHHASPVLGHHRAAAGVLEGVRHPAVGAQGHLLQVARGAGQLLRDMFGDVRMLATTPA